MRRWWREALSAAIAGCTIAALAGALLQPEAHPAPAAQSAPATPAAGAAARSDQGCVSCHEGIEDMHPAQPLTCVDCHGGNGASTTKEAAHVKAGQTWPGDERVLPIDFDLAYARFRNPTDLRVAAQVCGTCHADEVSRVTRSLHATTAGHLSDGLYENGVTHTRADSFGIFPVSDPSESLPLGAVKSLPAIPAYDAKHTPLDLGAHFRDVPRKACMRCHLWSHGQAVEGRLGQDGDYRGAGCAACHVTYADDGRSKSRDRSADHVRPGHPIEHRLTTKIPTDTCTRCHYGDASVGMHFRGLAQLVPGMPAGPDVPGTTKEPRNGAYYIDDPKITPSDVHHERGMHCIDCHTSNDVMGDGHIQIKMEAAVEIECSDCHGTFEETATLQTGRGTRLAHVTRRGDDYVLVSKVDGREHRVKQAKHVITPGHPDFNPRAAQAMTRQHRHLECYTCHAAWSVNFFGFHFDRNLAFTQLDLISGERTPGRVTTQEKVFAAFRQLYLGYNSEGSIAPYVVGFSTMGTVHGARGEILIDQALPVTQAGLSGMTLIAHNVHATREVGRACADCHRNPAALGLGSGLYTLARDLIVATDARGLEVLAYDRQGIDRSAPVAKLPLPGAGRVALITDEVTGRAHTALVVVPGHGIASIDLRTPESPARLDFLATHDPRDLIVSGDLVYLADGEGGVRVIDAGDPHDLNEIAALPTQEARSVALAWPYLYVADGPGGLAIVDVGKPHAGLHEVSRVDLDRHADEPDDAREVKVLFQPSRIDVKKHARSAAHLFAVVANGRNGVAIVDAIEPEAPALMIAAQKGNEESLVFEAVQVNSQFDLGSPGGEVPTREADYAYFLVRRGNRHELGVVELTDAKKLKLVALENLQVLYNDMKIVRSFNPPVLKQTLLLAGDAGIRQYDLARAKKPELMGAAAYAGTLGIAVESFSFDRLVSETKGPVKDISHAGARYFGLVEIERLLKTPLPVDARHTESAESAGR